LLGESLRERSQLFSAIVPSEPVGLAEQKIKGSDREEYLALTSRELQLGELYLMLNASGVGSVFPVGKKASGCLRSIWNGHSVSEASARPRAPRRFANPAALLELDIRPSKRLWWSKRDATSFFDTLQCPDEFTPRFGRPAVCAADLACSLGVATAGLAPYLRPDCSTTDVESNTKLYLCSKAWPMGCSWSSAVAPDVAIGLVCESCLDEQNILADSEPPPVN